MLKTVRVAELLADRSRVAHRGMVRAREHEAEAELVDRRGDPLGLLLELEAELPRARRRSPHAELAARLPCFGDRRAGCGGDDARPPSRC